MVWVDVEKNLTMTKKTKDKLFNSDEILNALKERYFRLAKNETFTSKKETLQIDKLEMEINNRMENLISENT